MTPAILYLLVTFLVTLSAYGAYLWGKDRGAAAERIKLYGNTLPRFENPPPPPKITPPYCRDCRDAGNKRSALWVVFPDRYDRGEVIYCCTDHMNIWVDRLQGKPYKASRIIDALEKKKGVPTMPNHPPMPKFEEKPLDALNDKYKFNHPPKWCTPVTREAANEVTQDQLIDALMDMRMESFIAAHCKFAQAGTDLYYLSRKEVAEYLLDMYYITPKAKH